VLTRGTTSSLDIMSDKTGRPTKDQLARDAKESAAQAAARDTIDSMLILRRTD
jgi:hypothetical protein